jgi:predicted nucleotidyltransferase component of viral defense system
MLYTSTVEPTTLDLLKQLMQIKELDNFILVGGTCLSLRYGHRISVDLDLFSATDFNNENLLEILDKNNIKVEYRSIKNPIGLFCFINNVKVDFVKHHYFNLIQSPENIDGIRMMSDADIMAMKIFAILKRATKKDFWDIAELLEKYSFADLERNYKLKYPNNEMLIALHYAVTYFTEADESEDPKSLKGQTWESVKKTIQKKVSDYLS